MSEAQKVEIFSSRPLNEMLPLQRNLTNMTIALEQSSTKIIHNAIQRAFNKINWFLTMALQSNNQSDSGCNNNKRRLPCHQTNERYWTGEDPKVQKSFSTRNWNYSTSFWSFFQSFDISASNISALLSWHLKNKITRINTVSFRTRKLDWDVH